MHMKHTYKYKFSIVTAVYNTADYIDEMMESLINQDIGFLENVQVLLVDDGSTDLSLDKCKSYEKKYPNNVQVISLNHNGVSNSRNEGINLAEGEYINFLDSDDKLGLNALRCSFDFLEKNYKEVDLVAIPLYFFDAEDGPHVLNYKFSNNRIIDISKEYDCIQLSSSSTFIKADVLKKYKFNIKLKSAEDAELLTKIIIEKGKYGVINNTKYYYRRRRNNSSATQGIEKKEWYLDYIRDFSYEMIKNNKENDKRYQKYIQYLVMYDLQWRINRIKYIKNVLSDSEQKEFMGKLIYILKRIHISIIFKQKFMNIRKKALVIYFKYYKRNI
ncbi:MAG: glycosyltransferase family 2 protein [Clostridium butyricum]|nr:glycosyltransferase family 2 protein [Clostridium butyricum]